MSGLMMRWARVIAAAGFVAAGPVLISEYIFDHHALSQSRSETRALADRYLERTETVVAESLGELQALREKQHTSCVLADRQAYGTAAFASAFVQQIGVADASGTLICGEPMGSLAQPIRLPASERGDPSVMLGILNGPKKDRQAVITLRVSEETRLIARIRRESLDLQAGPEYLIDHTTIGIFLDDGAEWMSIAENWTPEKEADAVTETLTSARYPIRIIVATSASAARATMAPLKTIVLIVSIFGGFSVFIAGLWLSWGKDGSGDVFTRAVENREFVPYYQPVFDLFTGELKGCEVLVRWIKPDGSMVPPGQFLPYAEATGLIRDITRQLMVQTVDDCGALYAAGRTLKLSINLTAMHFVDLEIVDDIRLIYADSGISYDQLCFEVTEQNPLKDLALSRTIIGRIQALGASVALDDVGTGHGGLAYLQKLGVDIIKIDKMFIDNLATDHSSQTIVETLVELGTQLGLGIIAEGVETVEQVEQLKRIGVSTAQGYLFAKPLPAAAFLELAWKMMEGEAPSASPEDVTPEKTERADAA
ncbi:EAL domain-containing protein [Chthonobacter albigriseus]|uniref:EAL domain-containing protein n=1 Tax=Chthonobacter albigriseus TaxID=1683161 RepID=UPI0015EEE58B